ncbi:MAG TPA: RsmD family RNA methyltransferase, partial [Acidimicrobiales bacterium]|nr:RsmD family RNA methyltransferase [Acidimicrobiales bacterium]
GIEALSRGAAAVTFVEADPAAVAAIRANLEATGLEGGTVIHADVSRFLDDPGPAVDLAFVDPPYAFADWASVLARLPAELAVLESRRPVEVAQGWAAVREARYGDTHVTTVRRLPSRRGEAATEGGPDPV